MMQHRSLLVVIPAIFSLYSACASDSEGPPLPPAVDEHGMPIPGNVNRVLADAGPSSDAGSASTATTAMAGAAAQAAAGAVASNRAGTGASAGQGGSGGSSGSADVSSTMNAAGSSAGAGAAGAGAQAGSNAGADGSAGHPAAGGGAPASDGAESGEDACGPDAMPVMGMTSSSGNGIVTLFTSGETTVIGATMNMIVPSEPAADDTLFLWPGIQPASSGGVAGFGVLQPVLTWGGSCNGNRQGTWWISGQYVYFTGFLGARCEGGEIMDVGVKDVLDIEFSLAGNVWTQSITNKTNGKTVKFDRDLEGQKQVEVLWDIELATRNKPVDDVIFTKSVIKLSSPQPEACVPRSKGQNDYISPVRASRDGTLCCIDKVILRAAGVAATSPDEP